MCCTAVFFFAVSGLVLKIKKFLMISIMTPKEVEGEVAFIKLHTVKPLVKFPFYEAKLNNHFV